MTDSALSGAHGGGARRALPELPPPEVAEFIRYAYRRRRVGWPEIYDDMCAIAARREFRGWDHARLAEAGVTFSLQETPRLAAWVRTVLPRPSGGAGEPEPRGDRSSDDAAPTRRRHVAARRGAAG
ncbi:MAG: hypothetical protein M3295_05900 [Chloroflexota bacterium]|nr:hypothetical protein [Chloroflexota bacterium]